MPQVLRLDVDEHSGYHSVTRTVWNDGAEKISYRYDDSSSLVTTLTGSLQEVTHVALKLFIDSNFQVTYLTSESSKLEEKRFMYSFVWSVAQYGNEPCTLEKEEEKCIHALKMCVLCRMLRINWTLRKTKT